MNIQTKKTAPKTRTHNPAETATSANGLGFFEDLKDQAGLKPFSKDFFEQLVKAHNTQGPDRPKHPVVPSSGAHDFYGDMAPGEAIDFKKQTAEPAPEKKANNIRPAIDWFSELNRSSEFVSRKESQEIQMQIKQIVEELRKLVNTSTVLKAEFSDVVVNTPTQTPGKYHLNFFTWMLSVIRSARMRVEDSGAWLNAMKSKKKNKQYWNMAKKHGTTFSLSNERVVSTQTG